MVTLRQVQATINLRKDAYISIFFVLKVGEYLTKEWAVFVDKVNKKELNNKLTFLEFGTSFDEEDDDLEEGGVKEIENKSNH